MPADEELNLRNLILGLDDSAGADLAAIEDRLTLGMSEADIERATETARALVVASGANALDELRESFLAGEGDDVLSELRAGLYGESHTNALDELRESFLAGEGDDVLSELRAGLYGESHTNALDELRDSFLAGESDRAHNAFDPFASQPMPTLSIPALPPMVTMGDVVHAIEGQQAVLVDLVEEARSSRQEQADRWEQSQRDLAEEKAAADKRWGHEWRLLIAAIIIPSLLAVASIWATAHYAR